MSQEKKVLFNGPVLRVEQSDLGIHLKDQWGKGGITAHTSTSELRDALRVFISSVEGEEMELVRKREPRAESSIYAPWIPPFRYDVDGQWIEDSKGQRMLDVRGWGFLTGFLGVHRDIAAEIQDRLGRRIAELLNEDALTAEM